MKYDFKCLKCGLKHEIMVPVPMAEGDKLLNYKPCLCGGVDYVRQPNIEPTKSIGHTTPGRKD